MQIVMIVYNIVFTHLNINTIHLNEVYFQLYGYICMVDAKYCRVNTSN